MPINPPQPSITLKGADGKLITAAGTTTKTARANLSGKLQRISDMPVEILTMIASYLMPLDMLNLMRSSEWLREFLRSRKQSRHVWVAARRNVSPPLPDCPPCISEPEYAHALFERYCEACGASRPQYKLYEIPIRLCKHCLPLNVSTGDELMKRYKLPLTADFLQLLSFLAPVYPTSAFSSVWNDWTSVEQGLRDKFYEPDFTAVLTRFCESAIKGDQVSLDEWQAYSQGLRESVLPRMNFSLAVLRWEEQVRDERARANTTLRDLRGAAVEAKLIELGVGFSEMPRRSPEWARFVRQPRALTDKAWETMRPRLMAVIENGREKQRVQRQQLLKDRRTTKLVKLHDELRGTSAFPGWRQITGLPSITSLLKVIDEGKEVTREEFMTTSPNILAEIEQLKQQVRHDLVELLMDAGALSPVAGSKAKGKERAVQKTWTDSEAQTLLDTPVALFICHPLSPKKVTDCRQIYSYQGLLEHWHNCHSYSRWDVSFICAAWDEQQLEKLARLLAALELPLNTTMAAIETRVRSGRAKCSCGYDCTREAGRSRPHLMLSRILEHILDPEAHFSSAYSTPKITFKPFPSGKSSHVAGAN